MIWNYKPNHQFIEETSVDDVLIAENKSMSNIVKPYRAIVKMDGQLKGTTSPSYIDSIFKYFEEEKATNLTLINNQLTIEQIDDLIKNDNRLMLFFNSTVPLQSFMKVLPFEASELPETSFDRLIIDWNNIKDDRELTLMFLNTTNKTLYRTVIYNQGESKIKDIFIDDIASFSNYEERKREDAPALYLTTELMEAVKYMYYMKELPVDQFIKVLFQDENIVQKTIDNSTTERYMDSMSFMTVDTKNRILNYVYPGSEDLNEITRSKLLNETFTFINDHGGFNADFRLSDLNADKHLVEYQLYFQGYPVFSIDTTTKLSITWGHQQAHKYRRPYYVLEMDIPDEMKIKELPSVTELVDNQVKLTKDIKDIVLGFYLVQNNDKNVFELEPAWFIVKESGWERIRTDMIGGMADGLE